jgi:hypothetical protein
MVRTVLQQWENVPTARHSINPTQTQCSVGWRTEPSRKACCKHATGKHNKTHKVMTIHLSHKTI